MTRPGDDFDVTTLSEASAIGIMTMYSPLRQAAEQMAAFIVNAVEGEDTPSEDEILAATKFAFQCTVAEPMHLILEHVDQTWPVALNLLEREAAAFEQEMIARYHAILKHKKEHAAEEEEVKEEGPKTFEGQYL